MGQTMLNSSRVLFLAMGIALSLTASALAQAKQTSYWRETIPTGIYASASCEDAEFIWVIVGGQEFYTTEKRMYLDDFAQEAEEIVHGWRRVGAYFARAETEGPIEYISWNNDTEQEPPAETWADILPFNVQNVGANWSVARYVPCNSVPLPHSLLHGETINFLLTLDSSRDACAGADMSACIAGVFAAVDKHPDGKLNTAELSRLVRILIHLGVAIQDETEYAVAAGGVLGSLAVAPVLSTAIIASYDYDGDDAISLTEITSELAGMGRVRLAGDDASVQDRARDALQSIRSSVDQLLPMLLQTR
jgi:hypothetical protein